MKNINILHFFYTFKNVFKKKIEMLYWQLPEIK